MHMNNLQPTTDNRQPTTDMDNRKQQIRKGPSAYYPSPDVGSPCLSFTRNPNLEYRRYLIQKDSI